MFEGKNDGGGGIDCGGGITIKVEKGDSAGSSCEGLQMYKRRKHSKSDASGSKSIDDDKLGAESVSQLNDKAIEDSIQRIPGISSLDQVSSRAVMNNADDCPSGQWSKTLLEQIYHSSCEKEDGLLRCIGDALMLPPENSNNIAAKETCHSGGDNRICTSVPGEIANGGPDVFKSVESNGSLSAPNQTDTDLCRRAFKDIITSHNFAQLSRLLMENFPGVKFDSLLDIKLLNERMKDGTYEKTPIFFHSDMQKVCMRLQKVGAEMVTIGKSLSEISKTSYCKQVGRLQGCSKDAELGETGVNMKQAESYRAHKDYACRCCGEKGDGRDCLVCDSCEEMYHISCIHLPAEQIPSRSWYCPHCNVNDNHLPHDNCAVCKKLHATRPPTNAAAGGGDVRMEEDSSSDETSYGTEEDSEKLQCCNICRIEINNGDVVRVCGHPYCLHKHYHVKCLTIQQLRSHGPRWYCPSCLCRACLTDNNDEKIVLCDGCDHAYHIYCMQPPRTTIPRGKWFCKNCKPGIQKAHKNVQRRVRNAAIKTEPRENEEPAGMEMLLTAAEALIQEEDKTESGGNS